MPVLAAEKPSNLTQVILWPVGDRMSIGSLEAVMLERSEIRDGGILLYDEAFFVRGEAEALFAWLRGNMTWGQEISRGRPFPRLTAFVADAGLEYRYSGVTHRGGGWPAELLDVKKRVEAVADAQFNSLLLNLYRDGRDSIGFHADDEPEL